MSARLEAAALTDAGFNEAGLAPAAAQAHDTGEGLVMAWMNRQIGPSSHPVRKRLP